MYMNYMDYTADGCKNIFTIEQKARMRSLFESGGVREDIKIYGQIMYATISGPSTICDQATYTINNLPSGATVQWKVEHNNDWPVASINSSGGVSRIGNGIVTVVAILSIEGTVVNTLRKEEIQVGTPTPRIELYDDQTNLPIQYDGHMSYLYRLRAEGESLPSFANYNWNVKCPGNCDSYSYRKGREIYFEALYEGFYEISLSVIADCGVSNTVTRYYYFSHLYDALSVSPNPASDYVTINMVNEDTSDGIALPRTTVTSSERYQIQLWNSVGLVKSVTTDQTEYQLDLSGVAPGFYYVHVIKDGQTYRQQLVVK